MKLAQQFGLMAQFQVHGGEESVVRLYGWDFLPCCRKSVKHSCRCWGSLGACFCCTVAILAGHALCHRWYMG